MNNEPLVTVLIPVYNRPDVNNTIKSIINQNYSNIEILIIDNASTDNTINSIRELKDDRIRLLVNNANMGQIFSLNRGLKEAKGKYIARIDSDDIALPNRIRKQVEFLEKNNDYVIVGSWVQFISDNNEKGMIVKTCTTDRGLRFMHTLACGIYHPSAMIRKDVLTKNSLQYDLRFKMAADYDLWNRIMKYGRACNIPEVLVYYRRGKNNDSINHRRIMAFESTIIRKRVCSDCENKEELMFEFNIEEKHNKNLIDCIKAYNLLTKRLNNTISKKNVDYYILKQHIFLKLYSSFFAFSDYWYACLARRLYCILKSIKNHKRGKIK